MMFDKKDVAAYYVGDDTICTSCIAEEELREVKEDDVILKGFVVEQEMLVFCDRCKNQIIEEVYPPDEDENNISFICKECSEKHGDEIPQKEFKHTSNGDKCGICGNQRNEK